MRKTIEPRMKIGEIEIASIQFDMRSRDEIPKVLIGMQSLYKDAEAKKRLFEELERIVPAASTRERAAEAWICGKFSSSRPCASNATGISTSCSKWRTSTIPSD